jgi:2-polyprenyl-3-methyl-5-hydroxy-6-metoxy-1,4-benzoquinol methylase
VQYVVNIRVVTMEEHYNGWVDTRQPPLFGKFPDAKLVDLAATLGPAARVPVLDVGAGTGRNTLPMARVGHPDPGHKCPAGAAEHTGKTTSTSSQYRQTSICIDEK